MFVLLKKGLMARLQESSDLRTTRGRSRQRGMTLIEIMVVVVIISLVAGVVGVQVFGQLKSAQISTASTQIKQISEALDLYRLKFKKYPSTGEGLSSLVTPKGNSEPFMNSIPEDPWGMEYVYIYPGSRNTGRFDLMSSGPDGVQGGGDDVGNWKQTE